MSVGHPKLAFLVTADWFFCSHFLARAEAAREAGYEVLVLSKVKNHGDIIKNAGLRFIPIKINRRSLDPLSTLTTLFSIWRIYAQERPLIVHHIAHKPILIGTFAARLCGIPYVVNAVVGGGYAFSSNRLMARLFRPFLRIALRVFLNPPRSRVIFENADDLNEYVGSKQVRQRDAVLIRGAGVDPKQYCAGRPDPDTPLVILAARLLWDKGIGEFVNAASILRAKGIRGRFAIVGEQDVDNRACINSAVLEEWRAAGVVELWGFRSDMSNVLAQATIACLPSYREGLPKFLLEAMAAGLPCVTTDVPGCREAVRNNDNGILVSARDEHALADALERLLLSPALCRQLGLRGRQRLEQEFSSKTVVAQTLRVYKEILVQ